LFAMNTVPMGQCGLSIYVKSVFLIFKKCIKIVHFSILFGEICLVGEIEKVEKENFLKDFESLRPDFFLADLYSDEKDLSKVAEAVRPAKTKTSLFSSIPMRCMSDKCPFADTCPLEQQGIAPKGKPCPIEMAIVSQFMESIMSELRVNPDNLIEVSRVRDLVDQEIQQLRATKLLAKESFIQENVIGVDDQGRPIIKKEMHLAVDLSDRLLKRKKEIRNQMMATREQRAKTGQAQLDSAQLISNWMDTIREVEEQKEKALRKKVGLDDFDEYVENDKAINSGVPTDIVDAEIVED